MRFIGMTLFLQCEVVRQVKDGETRQPSELTVTVQDPETQKTITLLIEVKGVLQSADMANLAKYVVENAKED